MLDGYNFLKRSITHFLDTATDAEEYTGSDPAGRR
jgi:hypothetical protein